jgi:uncharacterized cupredoxin-like copper-binding protein
MLHAMPSISLTDRLGGAGWRLVASVCVLAIVAACGEQAPAATGRIEPGSSTAPRAVNLIAKDYLYLPDSLDVVPGETVRLQIVNGGLALHEVVIGDQATQDAWATAEAGTEGAPPGPTPVVSVSPELSGLRVQIASGERVDVTWTVPDDVVDGPPYLVACHLPGHLEKGMQIPVRWLPAP